jgi:hypothetical protein
VYLGSLVLLTLTPLSDVCFIFLNGMFASLILLLPEREGKDAHVLTHGMLPTGRITKWSADAACMEEKVSCAEEFLFLFKISNFSVYLIN